MLQIKLHQNQVTLQILMKDQPQRSWIEVSLKVSLFILAIIEVFRSGHLKLYCFKSIKMQKDGSERRSRYKTKTI